MLRSSRLFQRALVIEDGDVLLRTLVRVTSEHAREVVPAGSMKEARSALALSFDLVITDVRFPDGTAFELIEALAARKARPAMLVITGNATTMEAFRLAQLGVDALLAKPFGLRSFNDALLGLAATRSIGRGAVDDLKARRSLEARLDAYVRAQGLTEQHRELLRASLRGVPRKQLASELGISENTCKSAVRRLLSRCRAARVADIINELLARDAGLAGDSDTKGGPRL